MIKTLVSTCTALGLLSMTALAGSHEKAVISAEILPGWETERGTQMVGLRLTLAPGWKTYWRAPGDAGIPPQFDWSASQNMQAVATYWPRPEVFEQNGMRTIGYKHEVVLPMELTPRTEGDPISLRGQVDLGVCQDICMPMALEVRAELPSAPQTAPIRAALADQPTPSQKAGVSSVTCKIDPIEDGLRLTASIAMPKLGGAETTVIELADRSVWVSEPQTSRHGNRLTAVTDLVPDSGGPFALDRSSVRITVLSGKRAVDIRGCTGG